MTRNSGLAALTLLLCMMFACSEGKDGGPGGATMQESIGVRAATPSPGIPSSIGFAVPLAEDLSAFLDGEVRDAWEGVERGGEDVDGLLHSLERELAAKGENAPADLIVLLALAHIEDASGLMILERAEMAGRIVGRDAAETGPQPPTEIYERLERPSALLSMVIDREPASSTAGALARINLASVMKLRSMIATSAKLPDAEVESETTAVDHLRAVVDDGPEALSEMARAQLGE